MGRIGGGHSLPPAKEVEGAAEVLGDEIDLAFLEGGPDDLARPDSEGELDRVAAMGERLPVQLGKNLAFGEVERGHPDGGPLRVPGRRRATAATAAAADGEGEERGRGHRPCACWQSHDRSLRCSGVSGYPPIRITRMLLLSPGADH